MSGISLRWIPAENSLTTIQSRAFFDCYHLNDITMPVSVTLEAENPFNYSNRDEEFLHVYITEGTGIGANCDGFYGWTPWASSAWYNHPTTVTIDSGVKSIGNSMFRGSDDIRSMTFPASLTLVDSYATYQTAFTCRYSGTAEQWRQVEIRDHNSASMTIPSPVFIQSRTVSVMDSTGNVLYDSNFYDVEECRILCAFYNADGRLVNMAIKAAGEEARFTRPGANTVRAKVLFLDSGTWIPQRTAEIIPLA